MKTIKVILIGMVVAVLATGCATTKEIAKPKILTYHQYTFIVNDPVNPTANVNYKIYLSKTNLGNALNFIATSNLLLHGGGPNPSVTPLSYDCVTGINGAGVVNNFSCYDEQPQNYYMIVIRATGTSIFPGCYGSNDTYTATPVILSLDYNTPTNVTVNFTVDTKVPTGITDVCK